MKMLTLEELRARSINEFYIALILDKDLPAFDFAPESECVLAEIDEEVGNASSEVKESLINHFGSIELAKRKMREVVNSIADTLVRIEFSVVIVKVGDRYQNLSYEGVDFFDESDIAFMRPFSKYYKEGEYQFVMYKGRPMIDVDSSELMLKCVKTYFEEIVVNELRKHLAYPTDE